MGKGRAKVPPSYAAYGVQCQAPREIVLRHFEDLLCRGVECQRAAGKAGDVEFAIRWIRADDSAFLAGFLATQKAATACGGIGLFSAGSVLRYTGFAAWKLGRRCILNRTGSLHGGRRLFFKA